MGGERIDRYLTQLYERLGARYSDRFWHLAWIAFLLSGPAAAAVFTPYLHPSLEHWLGLLAITEAGVAAMMLIGSRIWNSRNRVFVAWWQAGRPASGALTAWKVVGGLRVAWLYGWPLGVTTVGVPTSVYTIVVLNKPIGDTAAMFAAWIGAGGYAALLGFFTVDVYVRPVLRDAASRLPRDFTPDRIRLPIARRLFAALLMISGSTGFFLSFGLSIGRGSFGDLAIGLGLTTVFTLTTALLCTVMITGSTAGPVAELLAVMRRVRSGELGARVPVSSHDEFGLLAASFNDMTAELRRALARIVTSADAERRRVERDLHDGAQQQLVLMRLKLGTLERQLGGDQRLEPLLSELRDDLDQALAELRDLARGIYPSRLVTDGLPGALDDAISRATIPASLDCDGARRYRPELEAAVYFCCLEALQNAAKHAGEGATATIRLATDEGTLRFEVSDNGQGFAPNRAPAGSGLQNMTDRIGALGGKLEVESELGRGTTVRGRIPVGA